MAPAIAVENEPVEIASSATHSPTQRFAGRTTGLVQDLWLAIAGVLGRTKDLRFK